MKKITLFFVFLFLISFSAFAQSTEFSEIKIINNPVINNELSFQSDYKFIVEVNIYNVLGKLVIKEKLDIKNEKNINISKLSRNKKLF